MHLDTRYIARRQQSTLLPPALAPLARTSLCPVVAPRWGLTPAPGDHSGPPPTGQYPGLPPLHGDRPRERSARPWPTANWRERVSPATVARARARPQSSQSPSANWPTPRTPSIPSIRAPLAVGPGSRPPWPTAPGAHAHAHACPPWPSLRRPWSPRGVRGCGGRVQRSPSSSVAVELRPPPRGPVTLPHAGRLIASLIDSPALVGPPSCAQTLPCPEMIPGGRVVHQRWATWSGASISGCQLAGSLRVCRGRAGPRVRHGGVPNLGLGVPNLGVAPP